MTGRCQYSDIKSKKVWMDAQFEMPRTGRLNNSGRKKEQLHPGRWSCCNPSIFMVSLSVGKALFCKCSGHAPSSASHSVCRPEEVQFLSSSGWSWSFIHERLEGGNPSWIFWILLLLCSAFWPPLSLALPKSLGRLPKYFFGIRTTQNTIRENKLTRKMTAPCLPNSSGQFS